MYLPKISHIINHYDKFSETAEDITFAAAEEVHYDISKRYTAAWLNMYSFPNNYLKSNFDSALTQCLLCDIAYYEEWEKNFWSISHEERLYYLTKGAELYMEYMTFDTPVLKNVTSEELIGELEAFGSKDKISPESYNNITDLISKAENIKAGESYPGTLSYISIYEDTILISDMCFRD